MPARLAVLALAALIAFPAFAQPPQPAPEPFSEELEVREIGLLVEAPESLLKQLTLDAGDLLVTVDGLLRPVTRLVDEAPADWTVAVYIDEVLAPPETVALATLALARRSERLAGLGTLEVTVADPGPHPELSANREPLRIRQVLSDLSGRARMRQVERAPPLDAALLRRQCDRLIAWASTPRPPGPRLLFLVADGFQISPEEQKILESGKVMESGEGSTSLRAAMLLETARLLAAYGWITVPLPLRESREAELMAPAQADPEIDRFRVNHSGGSSKIPGGLPPPTQFGRRTPSPFTWGAALTLQIEPDLAPLRALVAPTGGKLVGLDALLDPLLDHLAGRWQLWLQEPAAGSSEGRTRAVEVRMRDGTRLRTRAWLRSSTPEEAAAARVRALLLSATGRSEGTLPLQIDRQSDRKIDEQGRLVLQLAVTPFEGSGPVAPGPVRISWAFADDEGEPRVHHAMAPGIENPGQGWSHTLTLDLPPGARRLAVAVDDLARERWSGTVFTSFRNLAESGGL